MPEPDRLDDMPLPEVNYLLHMCGLAVRGRLPKGAGYVVIGFDFGACTTMNYTSNAKPVELVERLRKLADRIEGKEYIPG